MGKEKYSLNTDSGGLRTARASTKRGGQKKLLAVMLSVLFSFGCAKERPFESLFLDSDTKTPKSVLTFMGEGKTEEDELYIYLPSTVNASRTSSSSRPHWMGDAKLVKLIMDKDEMRVVEVERDERFRYNQTNNSPVLRVPVSHVELECVKDRDGRCTNKEGKRDDISWRDMANFEINVGQMAVQEINFLPIQLTNLFYPCFNETGSNFVHYEASRDGLNIQIERSYNAKLECAGGISSLSDLSSSVRYHYSLIKLSSLETNGYKPLEYLPEEENLFGFFTTQTHRLDDDNRDTIGTEKKYVKRWQPNKTIVYHLSESFNNPEHAAARRATLDGINRINKSLELANTNLRIEVKEGLSLTKQGDLRYNTIVLEEDPLAFSVIGYGPSVGNPLTGEILNARTVMYLGTIKTLLQRAYEDLLKERLSQKSSSKGAPGADLKIDERLLVDGAPSVSPLEARGAGHAHSDGHDHSGPHHHHDHGHRNNGHIHGARAPSADDIRRSVPSIDELRDQVTNPLLETALSTDPEAQLDHFLHENCLYTEDYFNAHMAIEAEIDELFEKLNFRSWAQLNQLERKVVIDTLIPRVWIPIFIHEIGHNLGLRHNFSASEDSENFYTEAELKEMGVTGSFNYSSVMDYSYTVNSELPFMGKYDLAALRYAYANKLETKDGKLISLDEFRSPPAPNRPAPQLRDFKYCTDEHVSVNPNCNPFDEGENLKEIAQHFVRAYHENYTRRNLRNDRRSFSLFDDILYARGINRTMSTLRGMFERHEAIKRRFSLEDSNDIWESIDFLKDLKESVQIAADFYQEVLLMPDLHCGIAQTSNPNLIIGILPLRALSNDAVSCFVEENKNWLREGFKIVAEAGRSFQSLKDPRARNPYMDQIDVRGIWIDKALAMRGLFGRQIGISTFDRFSDNFLDIDFLRENIENTVVSILMDQAAPVVEFRNEEGALFKAQVRISYYDDRIGANGHVIPPHISRHVQSVFGLPNENVFFQEHLISSLKENLPSREQLWDTDSLLNSIAVRFTHDGIPSDSLVSTRLGSQRVFAHEDSLISSSVIQLVEIVGVLDRLGPQSVERLLTELMEGDEVERELSPDESAAVSYGPGVLMAYLQGDLQSQSYYQMLLAALAGL